MDPQAIADKIRWLSLTPLPKQQPLW